MKLAFTRLSGNPPVHDVIGVGFGPSNMAAAIAMDKRGILQNSLFFESRIDFDWHPGLLLNDADIQHNPLRDLVTPHDPTSPYGFLSYLKANNRLFDFLNLDAPFPPRAEYAGYVKWVGNHFRHVVRLGTPVALIEYAADTDDRIIFHVVAADGSSRFARALIFGTGRSQFIPAEFLPHLSDDVVHADQYLPARNRWLSLHEEPRIAVVGGSQSAIEIMLDLEQRTHVIGICRSFAFKHKDLSPFTERMYFPEFVDYFFDAGIDGQRNITNELRRSNYGGADPDVVSKLNLRLYERKLSGGKELEVLSNAHVRKLEQGSGRHAYTLFIDDRYSRTQTTYHADGIVLATGYKNFGSQSNQEPFHPLLSDIAKFAKFRDDGGIDIDRNFRLRCKSHLALPPIFINGLCESSHGFGDAGSFSLLSVRSNHIADALTAYLERPPSPSTPDPASTPMASHARIFE